MRRDRKNVDVERLGACGSQQALQKPCAVGGVCGCGVAMGCRPTSVQADAAIAAVIGVETRTNRSAGEGTTPHPPRRLTRPLGGVGAEERTWTLKVSARATIKAPQKPCAVGGA